eukprot:1160625-Pelagomonas_calceolata.AAC.10
MFAMKASATTQLAAHAWTHGNVCEDIASSLLMSKPICFRLRWAPQCTLQCLLRPAVMVMNT